MSRFNDRTLQLLGPTDKLAPRRAVELREWSDSQNTPLPAAFLEWAELGGGTILSKYSNDDWFFFDEEPKVIETPEGVRGILFHNENQCNFHKIVALDQGDDPPVYFGWCGKPPWVLHSPRFSDAIFAQIFDEQYLWTFDEECPEEKGVTDAGYFELRSAHCVDVLRGRFDERVTTQYVCDERHHTELRFCKSSLERITVDVSPGENVIVRVTGPLPLVHPLKAELLDEFAHDVIQSEPF